MARSADEDKDDFTERMIKETLAVIEETQLHITSVVHAARFVENHNRLAGKRADYASIHAALMEIENNEWRKLLMWGLVAKPKLRERVKAMARDRFLSSRSSVTEWLSPSHIQPSSWLVEEEETFRKMIEQAWSLNQDDD